MATDNELTGLSTTVKCSICGHNLPLEVCQSGSGYYLGRYCPNCGPYSRETGYYRTRAQGDYELLKVKTGKKPALLRDTRYRPGPLTVTEL